jgi:hypothetical protein
MIMMKIIVLAVSLLSVSSVFAADATMKADAQGIDSACTADAQTASCGSEIVGKGLLKCLHAYKKANKSYHFTPSCKAAMEQMHADKKAGK